MKNRNKSIITLMVFGMLWSFNAVAYNDSNRLVASVNDNEIPMNECDRENRVDENQIEHFFDISDMDLIEIDEVVELGFDTYLYLPNDFNPYKGMRIEDKIDFGVLCEEEEPELGFDTGKYLPKGFNPYACAK